LSHAEVFEPREPKPRVVLCTIISSVPIGCPGPDTEKVIEGVDVVPLDIMFDMWTCNGVIAPIFGSPIEVVASPKKVEFICGNCDRLLRRPP